VLLPKIKKIPKNTNGRLAIPALAGLLVCSCFMLSWLGNRDGRALVCVTLIAPWKDELLMVTNKQHSRSSFFSCSSPSYTWSLIAICCLVTHCCHGDGGGDDDHPVKGTTVSNCRPQYRFLHPRFNSDRPGVYYNIGYVYLASRASSIFASRVGRTSRLCWPSHFAFYPKLMN